MATRKDSDTVERERQPLLDGQQQGKDDVLLKSRWQLWPSFQTTSRRYRFLPLVGCFVIFLNEAEYFLKQIANLRATEAMYCIEFYKTRDPDLAELGKRIPERLCKDDLIQKQLARTAGLVMFFRMFSAMLGAIPLGQLADKRGRKPVLILHKINVVISNTMFLSIYVLYPLLPIWTLYFTGAPGLVGGNFDLGLAILFASYTDVMPSAGERATLFFLTTSMQYVAQLLCPPIGGWLMNLDGKGGTSEIAMIVALATSVLAALVTIFFIPETMDKTRHKSVTAEESSPESNDIPPRRTGSSTAMKLQELRASVSGVGLGNILLLALSILCCQIGVKANDWYGLVQYPVIKLGWIFSQATSVVSIQAFFMLLNFGVFLPFYTRVGTKFFGSAAYASFAVMIGSSTVLSGGSVMIALSSISATFLVGMILYTLGEGMSVATQAYIASLIEKKYLARVMAMLSVAAAGGKALASLLFPRILAVGLDTHIDFLVGLPFLVNAGLFLVAGACVAIVGLRTRLREQTSDVEHSDDGE